MVFPALSAASRLRNTFTVCPAKTGYKLGVRCVVPTATTSTVVKHTMEIDESAPRPSFWLVLFLSSASRLRNASLLSFLKRWLHARVRGFVAKATTLSFGEATTKIDESAPVSSVTTWCLFLSSASRVRNARFCASYCMTGLSLGMRRRRQGDDANFGEATTKIDESAPVSSVTTWCLFLSSASRASLLCPSEKAVTAW